MLHKFPTNLNEIETEIKWFGCFIRLLVFVRRILCIIICRTNIWRVIFGKVINGFVKVLDTRIWEGFGTVMGSFVCFFNRASEFDKIHIYCMSSSMMNVVAGLVRVSFVEWSTSVLLWYMLHVSSAKPWNLFGFTFITLLIFLFAWNFTFMCNFGGTLLNVLTNCCVFALITHVWRWFIWSVKSLSGF